MTVEDRLRAALHAEASAGDDALGDADDAWGAVQRRVRRHRARRAGRRSVAALAAVAAAAAAVVGIGSLLSEDTARVEVVPADSTLPPAVTPTTTPVEPEPAALFPGIWPFASSADVDAYRADPGVGLFFDAEATALEFGREYLGMAEPVAASGLKTSVDTSTASIAVTPRPGLPMVTRIHLQRFGDEGPWSVTGADTDDIRVDLPASGAAVGPTFAVSGESTAFEATVHVEVRADGGATLLQTFVMGGANGEMGPFADDLTIGAPFEATGGAIIFTGESAEDGTVVQATVVRVGFEAGASAYSVFFHRGEELVEVRRTGPATAGVLRQALEALFEGPQPEDGPGLSSLFSAATAGLLRDLNLRDGLAVVDLADTIDNASTSAGSQALLAELDATVFQFPSVVRVEYRLQGSCEAFWTWLQYDGCRVVGRDDRA